MENLSRFKCYFNSEAFNFRPPEEISVAFVDVEVRKVNI